jgi:osmotically inducible protein OsmC
METTAQVALEQVGAGFAITQVQLTLKAKVPGATEEKLKELAGVAKANCPVSKLLKAEIGLEVTLVR